MPKSDYLTKQQEIELHAVMAYGFTEGASDVAKTAAIEARNKLVLACHDLVHANVKKARKMFRCSRRARGERGYYLSDDIFSNAMEYLIKSMVRFDPSRGRLTTYATAVVWMSFKNRAYIASRQRNRFRNATDHFQKTNLTLEALVAAPECDTDEQEWHDEHSEIIDSILPLLPESWIVVLVNRAKRVPEKQTASQIGVTRSRLGQMRQQAIAVIHKCIELRQCGMPRVAEIFLRNLRSKAKTCEESRRARIRKCL